MTKIITKYCWRATRKAPRTLHIISYRHYHIAITLALKDKSIVTIINWNISISGFKLCDTAEHMVYCGSALDFSSDSPTVDFGKQ